MELRRIYTRNQRLFLKSILINQDNKWSYEEEYNLEISDF
jgi:hypothetical protein